MERGKCSLVRDDALKFRRSGPGVSQIRVVGGVAWLLNRMFPHV